MFTTSKNIARPFCHIDPRYYQLSVQSGLLLWGEWAGYFSVSILDIILVVLTALLFQWGLTRLYRLPLNPLSSLNTALSIILLLQASHWGWLLLAAVLAISSKFWLRWSGRHVFNPSNLAIVLVLLMSNSVWVAHGKWGHAIWLALLVAGGGLVLLLGWRQMLTSLSFLVVYSLLLLLRAGWLGDPWQIPLHQLQNGALLIFVFFMLSDPMTTPASIAGRLLYGVWVALLAALLQFYAYVPNAFLYALACSSPLVLLINKTWLGERFRWPSRRMI